MKAVAERIDHLGIVAGVIQDLGIVKLIDDRIPTDKREKITAGEAVAGMILNGLGFSDSAMSLTPKFFENKSVGLLFGKEVKADNFNRFKLSRTLDDCYKYGCDTLFSEISMAVCKKEKVDCRFNSEDTTSFSVTGEYYEDSDENAIKITHGYSKDHRPDLKQALLELMVTQDGGIPLISQSWSGNVSDNEIFKKRTKNLISCFKQSKTPRYLISDSKLYFKENIEGSLKDIPFITKVPATIALEKEMITQALQEDSWRSLDESNKYCSFDVVQFDLKQRWIIVSSDSMKDRASKGISKAVIKEKKELEKKLQKHYKKQFFCRTDAEHSLDLLKKNLKFHKLGEIKILKKQNYSSTGKPKKDASYEISYHASSNIIEDKNMIQEQIKQRSCYVLASIVSKQELNDEEIIKAYKRQNSSVERGFRFLKDPMFFTSSFFIKKPSRIMALLFVMTLALLVYSIAQRMLRKYLAQNKQTLPNQINQPTSTPTLRWIFQMMIGIDFIKTKMGDTLHTCISGLTEIRRKIINGFPDPVRNIYGLAS